MRALGRRTGDEQEKLAEQARKHRTFHVYAANVAQEANTPWRKLFESKLEILDVIRT
jgi:hypothetical protein